MEIQFPRQLKKLRTNLDMSQEDVAGKLYISRQAVSRWESGDATPDMSNLIKLAEIFDPRKGKYIRRRSEHMNFW